MAAPKKKAGCARCGRMSEPRRFCPITGEEISLVKAGDMWIAHTSLWTSRPFEFKDSLAYSLSHSYGESPDLPRPGVEVVRDANEPPGKKEPVGPEV